MENVTILIFYQLHDVINCLIYTKAYHMNVGLNIDELSIRFHTFKAKKLGTTDLSQNQSYLYVILILLPSSF